MCELQTAGVKHKYALTVREPHDPLVGDDARIRLRYPGQISNHAIRAPDEKMTVSHSIAELHVDVGAVILHEAFFAQRYRSATR